MASFKVKLVAYFLLLSLLPLAAAFWGFSTVAARSETRRVDARLQAGLRAALATYQERLDAAQRTANTLASSPTIQLELEHNDLPDLVAALRGTTNIIVPANLVQSACTLHSTVSDARVIEQLHIASVARSEPTSAPTKPGFTSRPAGRVSCRRRSRRGRA